MAAVSKAPFPQVRAGAPRRQRLCGRCCRASGFLEAVGMQAAERLWEPLNQWRWPSFFLWLLFHYLCLSQSSSFSFSVLDGVHLPSERHLPLEPCYSKCDLRTSSISIPGNVLEIKLPDPSLDLVNPILQLNKIPRWFVYTLKFESTSLKHQKGQARDPTEKLNA